MKTNPIKPTLLIFFILSLLILISLTPQSLTQARPDSDSDSDSSSSARSSNAKNPDKGDDDDDMGGIFGPGGGFGIPGLGKGWASGYGGGFGGPSGGYSRGGIIRPTVVCKEKGPCHKKKLVCPAKCFTSFSRSGKGYGGGGGGGGCTIDCKKKCIAYC